MGTSALLGDNPLSFDDKIIQKVINAGLLKGSVYFPDPNLPYGVRKPYTNAPDTYNSRVLASAITFIVLVVLAIGGRFAIRLRQGTRIGIDDGMGLLASIMGIVYLSMTIDFTVAGCYGHHIYFCSYRDVELIFRNFGIGQIIFYVTVYSAKISLLFLNRRMVAFTSGWWRRALWLLLGILIACLLFSSFSALFTCIPVSTHFSLIKLGTTDPSKLKCADQAVQNNFQYAGRAFHISTDLLLLIFPLTVIWSLEMALRKKLSLGFAFCFGLICTLASIMRIVVYQKPTNDFTFDSSTLVLWDTIDATFACIVASMPVYYRIVDFAVVSVHSKLNFLFARSEKSHKRVKNSPHARGRTDTDDQKSSVNCDTCQGDRDDSFGSSQKVNRESLQESRESVSQHQNRYDGKYSDDIELISKPRKSPELTLYTN